MVVNLTTDRRPAEAQYPRGACSDNKDDLGQEWLFKLLASSYRSSCIIRLSCAGLPRALPLCSPTQKLAD